MGSADIALVGVCIIGFALISRISASWPLTMPMVFVGVGALLSATGVLEVEAELGAVGLLTEAALAVILFSDAVRIDLRELRKEALVPTRLLLVGLPLSILLGAAVNSVLFPSIPLVEVALLAAILAPTDAALGAAVVEDHDVPLRERLSLNVESGLNDGLVVPIVAVLTVIAVTGSTSASDAVTETIEKIGFGVGAGVVIGFVAEKLLSGARSRGWSDGRYEQIATFTVPLVAYTASEALGGSGFLAAFAAGLTFGAVGSSKQAEHLGEFTEDAAQLLGIAAFFVFGNLFLGEALGDYGPAVWACALASLTVVRMVPVWISQLGTGRRWPTVVFVGWFGPRGLASIVFGVILLEDAAELQSSAADLLAVITLTVTASVVLHGVTAAWGASTYGRWARTADLSDAERADMFMDDMPAEMMPKARWGRAGAGHANDAGGQ